VIDAYRSFGIGGAASTGMRRVMAVTIDQWLPFQHERRVLKQPSMATARFKLAVSSNTDTTLDISAVTTTRFYLVHGFTARFYLVHFSYYDKLVNSKKHDHA
jgi:hypothetical protein